MLINMFTIHAMVIPAGSMTLSKTIQFSFDTDEMYTFHFCFKDGLKMLACFSRLIALILNFKLAE